MVESISIPNEILLPEVSRLLEEGKEVIICTKGSSMLPYIRGEKDSVKLMKKNGVREGDIVLAEAAPGRFVLHRVYSVGAEEITLMGDGNLRGREICRPEDIKGVVAEIIGPDGSPRRLTRGRCWKALLPVRRILLAIYRRTIL